jgi:exodeoxyribonuclease VII small subunit
VPDSRKKASSKKAPAPTQEAVSFEQAMQELENLVANMEKNELSLEASLKNFERGVELTRLCQSALQQAEQKIQILSKKMGQEALLPFEEDDA